MISIENDKVKYPFYIEIPEDYWVISSSDNINVEYVSDGDN